MRAAADEIGVDASYVCMLEGGVRRPSAAKAMIIERVTGVPMRSWYETARRGRAA